MKKDVLGFIQLLTGVTTMVLSAITVAKMYHKDDECANEDCENDPTSEETEDQNI